MGEGGRERIAKLLASAWKKMRKAISYKIKFQKKTNEVVLHQDRQFQLF